MIKFFQKVQFFKLNFVFNSFCNLIIFLNLKSNKIFINENNNR